MEVIFNANSNQERCSNPETLNISLDINDDADNDDMPDLDGEDDDDDVYDDNKKEKNHYGSPINQNL